MLQQLTLDKLRDGHEAVRSLNVRQVGRDEGIEALAASIAHHGLLAALVVAPVDPSIEDGEAYVIDGNRRLAALRLLVERGTWPVNQAVPVMWPEQPPVNTDLVSPNEISLAANVMRVAMHPADAYEAYGKLSADGLSAEDIARRFGAPLREVQKALALGRVAPAVIAAWRANEIDAKAVQAFTLAADDRQAEKILNAARKQGGWRLSGRAIREALGATDAKVKNALEFVGLDAYRAAGGRLAEDLFDGNHLIADPAIVTSLAQQKLQAECHRLVTPAPEGEGWAWASIADELPDGRWSWRHLESSAKPTKEERARIKEIEAEMKRLTDLEERDEELSPDDDALFVALESERETIDKAIFQRGFDETARAKSGCILSISHGGALSIDYAVVRPADGKKKGAGDKGTKAKAKKKAERGDPFEVSNALAVRLSQQLTRAVGDALPASPRVALAALLASLACNSPGLGYDRPLAVKSSGFEQPDATDEFEDLFPRLCAMTDAKLIEAAAAIASRAVDWTVTRAGEARLENTDHQALVAALDETALRHALRARFDPADYFASVPKATLLAAIEQALPGDQAAALKSKPRGEIEKFATTYLPATGWLPPALCAVPLELVEGKAPASTETKTKRGGNRDRRAAVSSPKSGKAKAKAKGVRKRASAPKRRAA
jgi:ParB family chromosome partitioning protein